MVPGIWLDMSDVSENHPSVQEKQRTEAPDEMESGLDTVTSSAVESKPAPTVRRVPS